LRHCPLRDQASPHRLPDRVSPHRQRDRDSQLQRHAPDSLHQGGRVQRRGSQQPGTERLQTSVRHSRTLLIVGRALIPRMQPDQGSRRLQFAPANEVQQHDPKVGPGNRHPIVVRLPICANVTVSRLLPVQANDPGHRHSPRAVWRSLRLDPSLVRNLDR
jgi:hypothetical protein